MIIIIVLSMLTAYASFLGYLLMIYYVGMLIPLIAAGVRRIHDEGKSGWYLYQFIV